MVFAPISPRKQNPDKVTIIHRRQLLANTAIAASRVGS
jgi:hypothetical protein